MGKQDFFSKMEAIGLALTYDDVRLKTDYSEVMPDLVDIQSKFSRNIPLKMPIVSAAMDTVTEHEMAIGMAKLGGIGVIHKNLTPEQQAKEVARVKHHLNGRINTPITVLDIETIETILQRKEEKGYAFHTFPVLAADGKFVGILSQTDFDFCENHSRLARELMTINPITALPNTTLDEAYAIMQKNKKKVLPLVDLDGKLTGMYIFSDLKRVKTGSSANYNLDANGRLRVAAAVGTGLDTAKRLELLMAENVDVIVVDTAHGVSKPAIEVLKEIKRQYTIDVVIGNISQGKSAKELLDAGADGIKVGQGPGSICTTRIVAGVGRPQVTAIYYCALALEGSDVPVCADGGINNSGDIPIAIGAGAHSVMLGRLLSGTKESPGDTVYHQGRQYKKYRGMGSLGAMKEHTGSRERYNQGKGVLVPEGVEGIVPYAGELAEVIHQHVGGLRKGMGYVGAATIEELRQKADFDRMTQAGKDESHPHDIFITEDAPNYSGKQ